MGRKKKEEIKERVFFRNRISPIPPEDTEEFDLLVKEEEEKILGGVTIDGVYISGWLYWHLNHWTIRIDEVDEYGNDIRVEQHPHLRDNEWIRAEHLEKCRNNRTGYIEVGARQGAKSETEASYFAMNAIMFRNTQNVIVCGNDHDLSLLKDKVDFGLKKMWNGLAIPRLDKTWRTNQVRLGYKTVDGEDDIWSYIVIRNAKDGHNTEVAAGTTAKSFIMDEIGKYPFGAAFKAAEPAFKGKNGWRAIPILMGTGGSFDNGQNAEDFFLNPEANNFEPVINDEGKKTGLFLSGLYRQDCKYLSTLGDYIEKERGIILPKDSELFLIPMYLSDKEKALQVITKERELAKFNHDASLYLKQVMYYPLTTAECFLSTSYNMFNVNAAKAQKNRIHTDNITGSYVELYHDGEKIQHSFVDKPPISEYPHKQSCDKDVPIVIWEMPIKDPPFGLYTAGVDPYRQNKAQYSNSLGAVYIFKRVHNIFDEKAKNEIVASYVARPDDKAKWNEQARLLIKYYNARTLCENDEYSFIDYMIGKGDEQYLEPEPQYLKSRVKNSSVNRPYGIHRSAEGIRAHLNDTLKKYLDAVIKIDKDENGSIIKEYTGIYKVPDPALLDELIRFNDDDNFDRVIAASLAISLGEYLNSTLGIIDEEDGDRRMKSYQNIKKKSLFTNKQSFTTFNKRRLF